MQNRNSILTLAFVIFANVASFACIKPVAIGNDLTISTLPQTNISSQKKPSFVQKILLRFLVRKMKKKWQKEAILKPIESKMPSKSMARTSFVFGFLGLALLGLALKGFFVPLSLILSFASGIVALVLGIVSIVNIKNHPELYGGKELAVPGIIFGILLMLFFTVLIVTFSSFWG